MSRGRLRFVGCGPGAPDLLTLRAVRALESADVVIWNAALLDRQSLAAHTRAETEIVEWPPATLEDILAVFDRALAEDLEVVRLKGGDPTLFGELEPELSAARERGLACEIVPGISALSASAAALGREIATTGAPLLLVDARSASGVDSEQQTAIVAWAAARDPQALQRSLLGRGLAPSTHCVVAIELSRRDETLVKCTLDELGETLEDIGRGVLTVAIAMPCDDRRASADEKRTMIR
jgi:siroheme synthase